MAKYAHTNKHYAHKIKKHDKSIKSNEISQPTYKKTRLVYYQEFFVAFYGNILYMYLHSDNAIFVALGR